VGPTGRIAPARRGHRLGCCGEQQRVGNLPEGMTVNAEVMETSVGQTVDVLVLCCVDGALSPKGRADSRTQIQAKDR
jgi:hypothetical protein